MCAPRKSRALSPLRPLEALGFSMLSQDIWALFGSILIQNGLSTLRFKTVDCLFSSSLLLSG